MKRFFCIVSGGMFYACMATQAQAASIMNLDTIPYDLRMQIGGEERMVSIEPGAKWTNDAYPIRVRYKDHWMMLEGDSEYAIWKGGTLTKQRRGMNMRGNGG